MTECRCDICGRIVTPDTEQEHAHRLHRPAYIRLSPVSHLWVAGNDEGPVVDGQTEEDALRRFALAVDMRLPDTSPYKFGQEVINPEANHG